MSRLGIRRRLLLVVVATVVFAVAGLVAGFNLVLERTLDRDASTLVRSRAEAQLASLRFENGRLTVGESPDESTSGANIWVFSGSRVLESPRVTPSVDAAARALIARPKHFSDPPAADIRLYAAPVLSRGQRVGTVVAAVSLAPYEETRQVALIASVVFGGIVLVLVALAAHWLLGAALRPVVRLTRQAAVWSERDLDHRFSLGPPHDELTELAATLDGLLDRLAASLRRERRFSAELSHELRTPLARVLAESELALGRRREEGEYRSALSIIRRSAEQLSRTVDALVAAARYEAGGARGTADATTVARGAAAACAGLSVDRGLDVELVSPPRPLRLGVEPDLAERILQPVLENACRYGSTHISVSIASHDSTILYTIDDDGPGVPDSEREQIFEPGVRGQSSNGRTGAGLGLALARRLARSVDGDVQSRPAARGARFVVRLPAG